MIVNAPPRPGSHEYRLEHGTFFPPGYHPYSNPQGNKNDGGGGGASGSAGTVQGASSQVVTSDPTAALDVAALDVGLPAAGFGEVSLETITDPAVDAEEEVIPAKYGYNPSLPNVRAKAGYPGPSQGYPVPVGPFGLIQHPAITNQRGTGIVTGEPVNVVAGGSAQGGASQTVTTGGVDPSLEAAALDVGLPAAGFGELSAESVIDPAVDPEAIVPEEIVARYGYNPSLPSVRAYGGYPGTSQGYPGVQPIGYPGSQVPHYIGQSQSSGGGNGGGAPETSGPYQTLIRGDYAAPPEDYEHGINAQWNYYPDSRAVSSEDVVARYGYNPALPTVRRFMGGMFDDPDPSMMHVNDNALTRGVGEFLPLDKIMGMLRQMGSEGKMGDAVQQAREFGGGVREDLPTVRRFMGGLFEGSGIATPASASTSGGGNASSGQGFSLFGGGFPPELLEMLRQHAQGEDPFEKRRRPVTASMNRGGMVDDAMRLQNAGTGQHNRLVHMTQGEIDAMNQIARSGIGGLRSNGMAINPKTGLPEAGLFSSLLPAIAGIGLTIASGGAASPLALGLAGAGGSLAGQAIEGEGVDLGRVFLAGLGGWGAGQLGNVLGGAEQVANAAALAEPATNVASGALTQAGTTSSLLGPAAGVPSAFQGAVQSAPNVVGAGVPNAFQGAATFANQPLSQVAAAPTTQWEALTRGLQPDVTRGLVSTHGITADQVAQNLVPDAAIKDAGIAAFRADPSFGKVIEGAGRFDPTSWASAPGTVGWQDVYKPAAALGLSAADTFGAFDPPEYDWDDDPLDEYQYAGPYLPRKRNVSTPPVGYQHGIDPAYQYYSAANKGGYVGALPTIRAVSGYQPYSVGQPQTNPMQQKQQQGLGFLTNLGTQGMAQPQTPQSIYSIDAATALANTQKRPMPTVRRQQGSASGVFANQINRGDKLLDVRDRHMRPRIVPPQAMSAVGENMAKHAAARRLMGTGVRPSIARFRDELSKGAARDVAEMPRHARVLGGAAARALPFVFPSKSLNVGEVGEIDQQLIAARAEKDRRVQEVMNRPPQGVDISNTPLPTIGYKEGSRNPMLMREKIPAPRNMNALGRWLFDKTGYDKGDPSGFMVRETAAQREDQRDIRDLQREREWDEIQEKHWTHAPHRLLKKLRGNTVEKQFGGPVDVATDGLMQGATPEYQANVAERRDSMLPPSEASLTAEEGRLVEMTILALQDQLDAEAAVEVVNEFVDRFGLDAYRRLEAEVQGDREFGGIIKPAVGDTPPIQGPDKIAGKIVDPVSGQQVANLEVGANEYISTAPALENEAREAGLPPTPDNGAIAMSTRQNELKAKYGGLMSV